MNTYSDVTLQLPSPLILVNVRMRKIFFPLTSFKPVDLLSRPVTPSDFLNVIL